MGRCALLALLLTSIVPPRSGAFADAPCWRPPVDAPIADPFRAPACPWCAGNRGIEYRTASGTPVRSVAAGQVTFSGAVAGTRYVVVEVAAGWRVTYGRLASVSVRRGARVGVGTIVGTSTAELFFGLRIHGTSTDPARHLGRWVGRPRLVPVDGAPARDVAPRWRCGTR